MNTAANLLCFRVLHLSLGASTSEPCTSNRVGTCHATVNMSNVYRSTAQLCKIWLVLTIFHQRQIPRSRSRHSSAAHDDVGRRASPLVLHRLLASAIASVTFGVAHDELKSITCGPGGAIITSPNLTPGQRRAWVRVTPNSKHKNTGLAGLVPTGTGELLSSDTHKLEFINHRDAIITVAAPQSH